MEVAVAAEEERIRTMTGGWEEEGHGGDWSLDCCQRFPRGGVDDRREVIPCERKVQRQQRWFPDRRSRR